MYYSSIVRADIANGESFRVSLFVSGCARNCPGCFNPEAQNPDFGKPFDDEAKQKIFKELEHEWCKGVSFLGGEPLSKLSDNRKSLLVVDWYKDDMPREKVKDAIQSSLDADLPDSYDKESFQSKITLLLNHFIDMAIQGYGWISAA